MGINFSDFDKLLAIYTNNFNIFFINSSIIDSSNKFLFLDFKSKDLALEYFLIWVIICNWHINSCSLMADCQIDIKRLIKRCFNGCSWLHKLWSCSAILLKFHFHLDRLSSSFGLTRTSIPLLLWRWFHIIAICWGVLVSFLFNFTLKSGHIWVKLSTGTTLNLLTAWNWIFKSYIWSRSLVRSLRSLFTLLIKGVCVLIKASIWFWLLLCVRRNEWRCVTISLAHWSSSIINSEWSDWVWLLRLQLIFNSPCKLFHFLFNLFYFSSRLRLILLIIMGSVCLIVERGFLAIFIISFSHKTLWAKLIGIVFSCCCTLLRWCFITSFTK